jgi:triosephosphate isomerase (TIM)
VRRKPIIAGNWKMNLDHLQAIQLCQQLVYHLEPRDYEASEIVVVPPFTSLRSVQTLIEGDRMRLVLGAQHCHWATSGAYTGEVSPPMLAKLKVRYVICGHSERRSQFGESDEMVNRRVNAVLAHEMVPILCVGETLDQRESGEAENVVVGQLRAGLDGIGVDAAALVVVAYEPVWAIGTGRTATPDDANDMCRVIRRTLGELYVEALGDGARIQYGGSVKPGNIVDLMRRPDIDGVLVGGASLDADDFAVICRWHRLQ